jgi:hypothetical protein
MQHACAVQYCPCDLCGCTIFFHIVSKMAGFSVEQFSEHKICFDFIYKTLSEIFLILRIIQRSIDINVYWFSCKVAVILSDCNKIWIFDNYSNTKFHENPSSGSRIVSCGQTDRHDEAKSRISQFLNLCFSEFA